jgi:hypothetical protein
MAGSLTETFCLNGQYYYTESRNKREYGAAGLFKENKALKTPEACVDKRARFYIY